MVDNFEEGALLLDSITEVQLVSRDTLFLEREDQFEVRYSLRYFSNQGEVIFRNTVKPKMYLNGNEVDKTEIDLSQETNYSFWVEFPNQAKTRSNVLNVRVLSLINAITEIKLEFIGGGNVIIPELDERSFEDLFQIELTFATGEKLVVNQDFFDFNVLVNGVKIETFKVQELNLGEKTTVQLAFKDIISNEVDLEVLTIKEAITGIEIQALENINQINKAETKGLITEFLQIKARLKNAMLIDLGPLKELFSVEKNEMKLSNLDIASFPDGKFNLRVVSGDVISNSIVFEVFDPMTYIKRIDLVLDERTRNIYAVAGSSKLDFTYEVIGMDESVLSIPASLVVDGKKQGSFQNVPITKAGMVQVHAEISGKKSNTVQIISRQNQALPKIRVPIVFHVLDNLNKNITKSVIDFEMEKLNLAFANQFELDPFMPKSSNAVNIHMEFYLADRDESGNLLSERGINRFLSGGQTFGDFSDEERAYLFQRMWDPRKYVNVFVGRMDRWGGYAYFPLVKDIDLPGVFTIDNDYVLHYPYVTVMSDNAMGLPNNATLAHEIGHMLALYHTFDKGLEVNECIDGDYCPDTETHLIDATNSLFVSTSNFMLNCQEETFISVNIMDYIQKSNSFTFDQRARMRTAAIYSPFFAKEGNYTNARLRPLEKGPLDHSIQPVFCPNQNHFGRRFHHH